jgi:hypothetical protein
MPDATATIRKRKTLEELRLDYPGLNEGDYGRYASGEVPESLIPQLMEGRRRQESLKQKIDTLSRPNDDIVPRPIVPPGRALPPTPAVSPELEGEIAANEEKNRKDMASRTPLPVQRRSNAQATEPPSQLQPRPADVPAGLSNEELQRRANYRTGGRGLAENPPVVGPAPLSASQQQSISDYQALPKAPPLPADWKPRRPGEESQPEAPVIPAEPLSPMAQSRRGA